MGFHLHHVFPRLSLAAARRVDEAMVTALSLEALEHSLF